MPARAATKSAADPLDADTRICVIHGTEDMLKKEALATLTAALEAVHGPIHATHFDGETATLSDVFDELRTLSLLQSYKLVIVDNADQFVKNFRKQMERYAAAPVDQATLLLRAGPWRPGNIDKLIKKVGAILKCDPLKPAEAKRWLVNRAKTVHQRKLSSEAAEALVQRIGCGLMRLDNELAKLALCVDAKETIDAEVIGQIIGRGSDDSAWVIQEAVLAELIHPRRAAAGDADRDSADRDAAAPGDSVIEKLHDLVDLARQSDVLLMYAVADLFRKFNLAMMMRRQGVNDYQIGRELKLFPPPRREAFMRALGRLDAPTVARLFDWIVDLDARSKSGFGKAIGNLECFCAVLADEVK